MVRVGTGVQEELRGYAGELPGADDLQEYENSELVSGCCFLVGDLDGDWPRKRVLIPTRQFPQVGYDFFEHHYRHRQFLL